MPMPSPRAPKQPAAMPLVRNGARLEPAWRLKRQTTLTIRQLADRLSMGSRKSLTNRLYLPGKARNARPK